MSGKYGEGLGGLNDVVVVEQNLRSETPERYSHSTNLIDYLEQLIEAGLSVQEGDFKYIDTINQAFNGYVREKGLPENPDTWENLADYLKLVRTQVSTEDPVDLLTGKPLSQEDIVAQAEVIVDEHQDSRREELNRLVMEARTELLKEANQQIEAHEKGKAKAKALKDGPDTLIGVFFDKMRGISNRLWGSEIQGAQDLADSPFEEVPEAETVMKFSELPQAQQNQVKDVAKAYGLGPEALFAELVQSRFDLQVIKNEKKMIENWVREQGKQVKIVEPSRLRDWMTNYEARTYGMEAYLGGKSLRKVGVYGVGGGESISSIEAMVDILNENSDQSIETRGLRNNFKNTLVSLGSSIKKLPASTLAKVGQLPQIMFSKGREAISSAYNDPWSVPAKVWSGTLDTVSAGAKGVFKGSLYAGAFVYGSAFSVAMTSMQGANFLWRGYENSYVIKGEDGQETKLSAAQIKELFCQLAERQAQAELTSQDESDLVDNSLTGLIKSQPDNDLLHAVAIKMRLKGKGDSSSPGFDPAADSQGLEAHFDLERLDQTQQALSQEVEHYKAQYDDENGSFVGRLASKVKNLANRASHFKEGKTVVNILRSYGLVAGQAESGAQLFGDNFIQDSVKNILGKLQTAQQSVLGFSLLELSQALSSHSIGKMMLGSTMERWKAQYTLRMDQLNQQFEALLKGQVTTSVAIDQLLIKTLNERQKMIAASVSHQQIKALVRNAGIELNYFLAGWSIMGLGGVTDTYLDSDNLYEALDNVVDQQKQAFQNRVDLANSFVSTVAETADDVAGMAGVDLEAQETLLASTTDFQPEQIESLQKAGYESQDIQNLNSDENFRKLLNGHPDVSVELVAKAYTLQQYGIRSVDGSVVTYPADKVLSDIEHFDPERQARMLASLEQNLAQGALSTEAYERITSSEDNNEEAIQPATGEGDDLDVSQEIVNLKGDAVNGATHELLNHATVRTYNFDSRSFQPPNYEEIAPQVDYRYAEGLNDPTDNGPKNAQISQEQINRAIIEDPTIGMPESGDIIEVEFPANAGTDGENANSAGVEKFGVVYNGPDGSQMIVAARPGGIFNVSAIEVNGQIYQAVNGSFNPDLSGLTQPVKDMMHRANDFNQKTTFQDSTADNGHGLVLQRLPGNDGPPQIRLGMEVQAGENRHDEQVAGLNWDQTDQFHNAVAELMGQEADDITINRVHVEGQVQEHKNETPDTNKEVVEEEEFEPVEIVNPGENMQEDEPYGDNPIPDGPGNGGGEGDGGGEGGEPVNDNGEEVQKSVPILSNNEPGGGELVEEADTSVPDDNGEAVEEAEIAVGDIEPVSGPSEIVVAADGVIEPVSGPSDGFNEFSVEEEAQSDQTQETVFSNGSGFLPSSEGAQEASIPSEDEPLEYTTYEVQSGDTLYGIITAEGGIADELGVTNDSAKDMFNKAFQELGRDINNIDVNEGIGYQRVTVNGQEYIQLEIETGQGSIQTLTFEVNGAEVGEMVDGIPETEEVVEEEIHSNRVEIEGNKLFSSLQTMIQESSSLHDIISSHSKLASVVDDQLRDTAWPGFYQVEGFSIINDTNGQVQSIGMYVTVDDHLKTYILELDAEGNVAAHASLSQSPDNMTLNVHGQKIENAGEFFNDPADQVLDTTNAEGHLGDLVHQLRTMPDMSDYWDTFTELGVSNEFATALEKLTNDKSINTSDMVNGYEIDDGRLEVVGGNLTWNQVMAQYGLEVTDNTTYNPTSQSGDTELAKFDPTRYEYYLLQYTNSQGQIETIALPENCNNPTEVVRAVERFNFLVKVQSNGMPIEMVPGVLQTENMGNGQTAIEVDVEEARQHQEVSERWNQNAEEGVELIAYTMVADPETGTLMPVQGNSFRFWSDDHTDIPNAIENHLSQGPVMDSANTLLNKINANTPQEAAEQLIQQMHFQFYVGNFDHNALAQILNVSSDDASNILALWSEKPAFVVETSLNMPAHELVTLLEQTADGKFSLKEGVLAQLNFGHHYMPETGNTSGGAIIVDRNWEQTVANELGLDITVTRDIGTTGDENTYDQFDTNNTTINPTPWFKSSGGSGGGEEDPPDNDSGLGGDEGGDTTTPGSGLDGDEGGDVN